MDLTPTELAVLLAKREERERCARIVRQIMAMAAIDSKYGTRCDANERMEYAIDCIMRPAD